MRTLSAKANEVQRRWWIIDAADQVLGRVAARAANILRGKEKAIFTPHMDAGDFVIVVNAEKIRVTGKKETAKTFRDLLLDDYLGRKVELGAGWGRFKGEPMLRLGLQVRLADTVATEFTVGQVQGLFSGTDFWHISLVSEPWSDRRFSPYVAVGLGKFKNIPNSSLVDATTTNAKLAHASLGLRWHMTERFTARLDYTLYTAFVSDTRSTEYRSVTAGLGFFF